jgi:predicted glycosyltransferase involved in capsule biosynthesis
MREGSTLLSVVVPLRTDDFAFYSARLMLRDALVLENVEMVVVDDGSSADVAAQIGSFCKQRGYEYVRLESSSQPFSLSRARNAGLQAARGEFVYLDDADLVYSTGFFQAVLNQLQLLHATPFNFLSVPAVYLTAAASSQVFADGGLNGSYPLVVQALLLEDPKGGPRNEVVEHYAPASGVMALRRDLALQVGGYDEGLTGWGGEDRDFVFRLLAINAKLPLPAAFRTTEPWNLNDTLVFQGWRSLHRIHGEFMARQGLYAVHLHHERLAWRKPMAAASNMKRAAKKALNTPVAERLASELFDLQSSLLFDAYRASSLLAHEDAYVELMDCVREINCAKEVSHKVRRPLGNKLRKLFISPTAFLRDSRFAVLRGASRLFRT